MRTFHSMRARLGTAGVLIALAGCIDNPPYAQFGKPWVPFVLTTEMAGAYDPATLRFHGDTAEVSLLFRHATPAPMPGEAGSSYSVVHAVEKVHCPSEQIQDLRMWVGATETDSLNGYVVETPAWVGFADHSMSRRILDRLCAALTDRPGRRGT